MRSDDARRWAALAALGATAACFVTGESLPVGLLTQLSHQFGVSLSATGLLVTVYAGVIVVASAPLVHLTREVPRRLLLSGALVTFAAGTLAAAVAPSYGWMLAVRVATAGSQAVFWAVGPVAAAGLFSPEARGRAVAGVFGGSSLAIVVGVPAGTWLGQQAGWRVPFIALAAVALLTAAAIARLLPTSRPSQSHAARGSAPDRRRYRLILVTTMLAVSAFYASFTYISAFLTKVSGLPHHDVAVILLATGVASTLGLVTGGALQARLPARPLAIPVALMAASLFGVWALGRVLAPVVALEALVSLGFGGFVVGAQTGVLVSAPRSADIATAWYSASFNVGIASGPLLGGLALSTIGLRQTVLVGGVLAAGALVAAVVQPGRVGRSPEFSRSEVS